MSFSFIPGIQVSGYISIINQPSSVQCCKVILYKLLFSTHIFMAFVCVKSLVDFINVFMTCMHAHVFHVLLWAFLFVLLTHVFIMIYSCCLSALQLL